MEYKSIITIVLLTAIFSKKMTFGFVGQEVRKCKYLRMDKLLKIRCYDMNLKDVPHYLSTSVEVLDLSFNRIKKLRKISFQHYKKIKYLLLYENMIQSVESGTFAYLTLLEEIDLSNNALMTIPLEIFQLPLLRNLYVDSNDLMNLSADLEELEKPIKAPLEYLNIADCGLADIPNLGILPNLWHINVSSNPLNEISIENFAYFCNLKSIDFTKTRINNCACQQVNILLRKMSVRTKYVPTCSTVIDLNECPFSFNWTVKSSAFLQCQNASTVKETKSMWLNALSCFSGLVALLFVFFCCAHWRRGRQKNKTIKKIPKGSPQNATKQNQELLQCVGL